jgi:hypothetical protein
LDSIKFNTELSKQLKEARNEIDASEPQPILLRDNWMLLAEIRPSDADDDTEFDDISIDTNYDWLQHQRKYSTDEIANMRNWVDQQKIFYNQNNDNDLPAVHPSLLNNMQRFAYNVIEKYKNAGEQLLMIINGTAGKKNIYCLKVK